ncbi:MAG TPA: aldo/keto reductase [Pirellulales bacterium]|nr:aldo/keto reductase [Pirellulales bacterium]
MDLRPLGKTGLKVSSVALGCWPIAGMSSSGVTDADSLATVLACFDLGINFLDTAYAYGMEGESERLIARALASRRSEMVIATKGGIEWAPGRKQVIDGAPATLRRQCEASLKRLATDRVELYYLHAPDPQVPIAESAGEIGRLIAEGKALSAGVSNVDLAQLKAFAAACPLAAFQPPCNMLQREIEADTLPWCREHDVSVMVYWPLLKGLLAGQLPRDHVFEPGDSRLKYPMFQGAEWQKNQDLVDRLRAVAADAGHSVAEVVINWTIHQPGITAALCGAKRPDQIRDNAGAMGWRLSVEQLAQIDAALAARGRAITRMPV